METFSQPYRNLLVWQKADVFVIAVYTITKSFPRDELYGITSQLRRAAVSIPLNIIEGKARKGPKEFLRFLHIARGSLTECAYLLDLSHRLSYCTQEQFISLEEARREVSFLLQRLIDSLSATSSTSVAK